MAGRTQIEKGEIKSNKTIKITCPRIINKNTSSQNLNKTQDYYFIPTSHCSQKTFNKEQLQ